MPPLPLAKKAMIAATAARASTGMSHELLVVLLDVEAEPVSDEVTELNALVTLDSAELAPELRLAAASPRKDDEPEVADAGAFLTTTTAEAGAA